MKAFILVLLASFAVFGQTQSAGMNHIRVNGYDFAYKESGQGEVVLLVHGSLTDLRSWDEAQRSLSRNFRVISYSRRYHFPNRVPAEITDYSPASHAQDLIALIEGLKLGPVHLVGHSYGGLVALLVAQQRPDLVRTLTLADPSVFSLIAGTPEMAARQEQQAALVEQLQKRITAGHADQAAGEFVDWVRNNDGWFAKAPAQTRQLAFDNSRTLLPSLGGSGMSVPFRCEDAKALPMPILVVRGEQTRTWYSAADREFARCCPTAKLTDVPNASHYSYEDNPGYFDRELISFLQKH